MQTYDVEKPIGECTIHEILDYLADNVPTLAMGIHVPDDGDSSETVVLLRGNRAAVFGLAEMARTRAKQKMMETCNDGNEYDNGG
jgi:hypothetical protein